MSSVLSILFLHLWYEGAWIIHYDLRAISVFEKVAHTVVEYTILGHIKYWFLWDMNEKLITVLTVISH